MTNIILKKMELDFSMTFILHEGWKKNSLYRFQEFCVWDQTGSFNHCKI